MVESSIITSLCWVSRGYANPVTTDYIPTKKEVEAYKKLGTNLSK
jgi:hypothetical protein